MKKIIVLLLFLGLFSLVGCSNTVKIQNKRVSVDKVYEAEVDHYIKGAEVVDGKLVSIYYLNIYLKDVGTTQYSHTPENQYYIKVYEDENAQDIWSIKGDIIQVKAKELIPGWIKN